MPTEVIMPKVDMDMEAGRIVVWHVEPGSYVSKGQPLFDIETDKAAMEVESPADGVLRHRLDQGSTVAIGKPVAWLYAQDEVVGDAPEVAEVEAKAEIVAVEQAPLSSEDVVSPDKVRATPLARKRAHEAGIDLAEVSGSAVNGRITRADIEAHLPGTTPTRAGELAITKSGQGSKTPVFFIHGLAADAASWARLVEELPQDRELYRIDLPCHGRSPDRVPADFRSLVAQLRHALDGLDLTACHLVGHSLGGALALALADTRPRDIKGLTLISPAGLGAEIDGVTIDGLMRASRPESLAPWLKRLVADPDLITASYARLAMAGRSDPTRRAAQTDLADAIFPDGVQSMDLTSALERLEIPARIIFGRADRVIPWAHALQAPGHVSLNLFAKTGHLPQLEAPKAVASLIASMLD